MRLGCGIGGAPERVSTLRSMERKLATVLFVDIVDSTSLVTASDPEVVRRRVNRFFEMVSHCVTIHGGIVEKFAGDAVLAAFGVPQAHEDDALRAARAALAMREAVVDLGLEARIGFEAGEVVVEDGDSSFVTGEAVNMAARLQQVARPGEILVGPTANRLTSGTLVVEDAGPLELKGLNGQLRAWRVMDATDGPARPSGPRAPLVGREAELELLENTFARTVRDGRAHLFTIFGEPGIGKSRLAREFVDGLERASVLTGRALPYGEGVTYWPLAEMVKAAAGISDDDPLEEAFAKLKACCEEETVADVLGLASGMLEALEGERSAQEISWAAREVMETLGDVQPLVLFFEDIHWAEEPLLDLIEHLADWVRAPLLILCLARPELLDARPGWGGGRVRSTAIELEPLSQEESELLVEKLVFQLAGASGEIPPPLPDELLERTEGNPLFVEETIRMLVESGAGNGGPARVPDTLQALIAARIDHLSPQGKTLLQRAAVIGRVFWKGALEHLSPDIEDMDSLLDDLLMREFLLREPRSSISGEHAYRFKHLLIREVAYTGLAKLARAHHHARFAQWLAERTGDELMEIRAYHLDQSVEFLTELEGAPPEELANETAGALVKAAKRAIAREAYGTARKLGLRAIELRPTLWARYVAARAAWRLQDWASVQVEMEKVRDQARSEGERVVEALALTGLAEANLKRNGDAAGARVLVDEALRILAGENDPVAHFDALMARAVLSAWLGSEEDYVRYMERAYATALDAQRKDLQTLAAQALAGAHLIALELDEAELLITRALELAGESGSVRARMSATLAYGWFLRLKGELDAAETVFEEVRSTAEELGIEPMVAGAVLKLGWLARSKGDLRRSEKMFREAVRLTSVRGDRGLLPDYQAALATTLVDLGKVDEAERLALEAAAHAVPEDTMCKIFATTALASVRAAQKRDDEAEELFLSAIADARSSNLKLYEKHPLERLIDFLRERERDGDAEAYEARLAELSPPAPESTAKIA
jgi:class 3 adenylate cyclase/tetratricopeptide (TPR) repeat protein